MPSRYRSCWTWSSLRPDRNGRLRVDIQEIPQIVAMIDTQFLFMEVFEEAALPRASAVLERFGCPYDGCTMQVMMQHSF